MKNKRYYLNLAKEAAKILDQKKAENIEIYDVESKTGMYYYAIFCLALSPAHIKALEEEIVMKFKKEKNEYLLYRDGIESSAWKVLDYGGIIIHILDNQTREFYSIDKLYVDCRKIKINTVKKKEKIKK